MRKEGNKPDMDEGDDRNRYRWDTHSQPAPVEDEDMSSIV